MRLGAFARDLGAGSDVDRLERARQTREAHAIEIAEVRNETEESLERVIVIVGHGARRLAPAVGVGEAAATPARFERATNSFEGCCSNPLSYGASATKV